MSLSEGPRVSVILPAYESQATLQASLETMVAQTYEPYEVILIDSSPHDEAASIAGEFPEVRYVHHAQQLLPHAARNRGAEMAAGDLLLFSDPDVYAQPDWLQMMVAAHQRTGGIVTGAITCHGRKWLDMGTHFSKFDQWLPGGPARPIGIGPTASLLLPKAMFKRLGRFDERHGPLADAQFSWHLARQGQTIWFEPSAVVAHHHRDTWRGLVRQMFQRGRLFGNMRATREGWGRPRLLGQSVITLLPLRLAKLVARIVRNAARAGLLAACLWTLPVIVSAQAAWLAGEAAAYLRDVTPKN